MKNIFLLSLFIITALTFAFTSSSSFSLAETETALNTDDNQKEIEKGEQNNENNETVPTETKTSINNPDNQNDKGGEVEVEIEENEKISEENNSDAKETLNETQPEINKPALNPTFSKEKQQRILNLAANISNRQEAVIKRHQQILSRLESRQEKLAEQNFNTKNSETAFKQIKQNLENTKNHLKNIDNLVYEMVSAPNPKENWLKIKTLFQKTATEITKNQTDLKNLLSLLKDPSLNQLKISEEETENNPEIKAEENLTTKDNL